MKSRRHCCSSLPHNESIVFSFLAVTGILIILEVQWRFRCSYMFKAVISATLRIPFQVGGHVLALPVTESLYISTFAVLLRQVDETKARCIECILCSSCAYKGLSESGVDFFIRHCRLRATKVCGDGIPHILSLTATINKRFENWHLFVNGQYSTGSSISAIFSIKALSSFLSWRSLASLLSISC